MVCIVPLIPRVGDAHAARLRSPQRARTRYVIATVSWGRANAVVPKRRKKSDRQCRVMRKVTIPHQSQGFPSHSNTVQRDMRMTFFKRVSL